MVSYPLEIQSQSTSPSGIQNPWSSTAGSFGPLEISIPREFDGPNTNYSPEDLFAMALVNCFTATFKVVAEKSRFDFEALEGRCVISIDHDSGEKGTVRVTGLDFEFNLKGAVDQARAERLLDQTSRQCILINSLKALPKFQFHVD